MHSTGQNGCISSICSSLKCQRSSARGYLCFVPRSRRIQRSFALGGAGSVVV